MNINFENLTNQVKPRGVIHVGANTCQELPLYLAHGIENRLWIEGNERVANQTREATNENILCAYVSNEGMMQKVYEASNNSESSSIKRPTKHTEIYPDIEFIDGPMYIKSYTLDLLLRLFDFAKFNYLVLDIQGAELDALKGLGMFEHHFEVVITEAYIQELYQNCGKLHEIEAFLTNYKLVEFAEEVGKGWGDAAFIRKDLLK
jgi:FkbM family methyltransferase